METAPSMARGMKHEQLMGERPIIDEKWRSEEPCFVVSFCASFILR
jgi:hypothetical protein